jgi:hypothetical protein
MVRVGGAAGDRAVCPNHALHGGREQAMTSMTSRLRRLEAGCRQYHELVADRRRLIQKASFKHLSLDQKKCLQAAIRSYQQGRPLTGEEAAVVTAFDAATEQACRKAGITAAEYRGCL